MKDIIWQPTKELIEKTNIYKFMQRHNINSYDELVIRSTKDIEWFWRNVQDDIPIEWYKPFIKVLDDTKGFPWTRWFIDGKINIVHNCIDRHITAGRGSNIAFIWEGDNSETRHISYNELNLLVCKTANGLKRFGINKGDAIGIYMPMIPEMVFIFFACLKIGAVVIPIFSGFGPYALATRLADAKAKLIFTADGYYRRGKIIKIKENADKAAPSIPSLNNMIVVNRLDIKVNMYKKRDVWWSEFINNNSSLCLTEVLDAEEHALIIYTSGTTGKPKGTVHTHAGSLVQMSKEIKYYFDLRDREIFFWFTDIGWMMGPWEIIGVQCLGGTYVIYEGVPDYPEPDRLWKLIEAHSVTTLGISPTAIRLLKKYGDDWLINHHLSSLRILGSTGEPWDPISYMWYFEKVGHKRCPIINISGGTEIVGCLLAPVPIIPLKPCTLGRGGLGMDIDVFNDDGISIKGGIGHLVCKKPAPSMTKSFLNDPQRYLETYFSRWQDIWYHGDWAKVDEDGYWFLYGRSDDTIKVAGKRIGPAEIEAVLIKHPLVSEAAAIGVPHPIKGEAIVCFVALKTEIDIKEKAGLREELKETVVKYLGKSLKPAEIRFVKAIPKTRSAKIVRGVIKNKFLGKDIGDTSSIENIDALDGFNY